MKTQVGGPEVVRNICSSYRLAQPPGQEEAGKKLTVTREVGVGLLKGRLVGFELKAKVRGEGEGNTSQRGN